MKDEAGGDYARVQEMNDGLKWPSIMVYQLVEEPIINIVSVTVAGQYHGIIDHSPNLREDLDRTYYKSFLHKQIRSFRSVLVRSELAGVGAAGDAFPLSEVPLSSRMRGIGFYAVTAFAAIMLLVLMLVAHPFMLLLDKHRRKFQHFVAKIWATITISPFFRVEFEGMENLPAPDTPAFISKTSIFVYPIIGWAMFLLGTIPLKSMDSRSQLECLKQCMDLVNKGASVFFFPEGTRGKDGKLGVFKKGAFSIASQTGAPVVPITIIGTGKITPPGLEGIVNSGSVKVIIHKPIEGDNPEILCNEARRRINDALQNFVCFCPVHKLYENFSTFQGSFMVTHVPIPMIHEELLQGFVVDFVKMKVGLIMLAWPSLAAWGMELAKELFE
ncbi:Phospholipid/glycerol acyltransferase [Dillenia turbinata]|uniref:Phospholipid/glycerol acyltransferase n=1 Tax=Dillenia turbinata TaxID=194707 RepID=A0AAN8VXQ5_9MAGN